MPSYKNYIIISSILFCFSACVSSPTIEYEQVHEKKTFIIPASKYFNLEDQYIIYALEYENLEDYDSSRKIYFKLFENTNKYEYLEKYLNISFALKDYAKVKEYCLLYMMENIKEEEQMLKLYTFSLLNLNEKEETIKSAEKLVKKFNHIKNNGLLASIYFDLKEYKKAEEKFIEAYKIDESINTLQTITSIQFYYTNKKAEAINTLKEYIKKNSYSFSLSLQLLSFYEKDKQKEKIIPLLEKMYSFYKQKDEQVSLLETQNLIIRYLINEDKQKAIKFLEKNKIQNEILLSLYENTNELEKAYKLLDTLYIESNNPKFLAEQAILEFEMAENKEEVLDSVILKFNNALKEVSNPTYENYLAYILIDYDLDIKRGLILVKKALAIDPNNLAYIDTLAWGEYKNKDCKNAYINMKRVIDNAKINDDEMKLHWKKIKECVK